MDIFKMVKSLVIQEQEKRTSREDQLKKRVNNFEIIADQMKKCRKGLSANQGTEILSAIGKDNDIPLSIIAQNIDDFQEEHITSELIQFTKGIKAIPKKNHQSMVLSNVIRFLTIKEVISLIPINKECSLVLQKEFFQLLSSVPLMKRQFRLNLWFQILEVEKAPQILPFLEASEKLDLPVLKMIDMDVKRSFNLQPSYPKEQLVEILRVSSLLTQDQGGYCQGQNYLAGFFLKFIGNQEMAFKYYHQFLVKYMMNIFDRDFKSLQCYFYILDKLVKVHLPTLSAHFRNQKLNSSFFTAQWFITVFTIAFQFTDFSYLAIQIMDTFMVDGIRGFFKSILLVLQFFEGEFLKLNFEEILEFATNLLQTEVFKGTEYKAFAKRRAETHVSSEPY